MMNYSLKNGENALRASKEIAEAAGSEGMIGGQVVDIINEGKNEISEDELKNLEDKVQKLTDKYVAEIDAKAEAKSKDILTV